jgi:hypothetical protein
MRLHKPSLALAAGIMTLAAMAAVESAAAQRTIEPGGGSRQPTSDPFLTFDVQSAPRAPQPSQGLPSATSRPANPDMRGAPNMGGSGMRGTGGGRMNGGKGRR